MKSGSRRKGMVDEGLDGVPGRSARGLPLTQASLGLFQLTRWEVDLSSDRCEAMTYLKTVVPITE
jgi:hypothetical protein